MSNDMGIKEIQNAVAYILDLSKNQKLRSNIDLAKDQMIKLESKMERNDFPLKIKYWITQLLKGAIIGAASHKNHASSLQFDSFDSYKKKRGNISEYEAALETSYTVLKSFVDTSEYLVDMCLVLIDKIYQDQYKAIEAAKLVIKYYDGHRNSTRLFKDLMKLFKIKCEYDEKNKAAKLGNKTLFEKKTAEKIDCIKKVYQVEKMLGSKP